MLPFGVTIPAAVPQRSEIPEGLTNYPVHCLEYVYKHLQVFVDISGCKNMRGMSSIKFSNLDTYWGMECHYGCEILLISTNPWHHCCISLIPILLSLVPLIIPTCSLLSMPHSETRDYATVKKEDIVLKIFHNVSFQTLLSWFLSKNVKTGV